jgi:hypothetical protein
MKPTADKRRKQRAAASTSLKPPCGTLSYLAECRGASQKAEGVRRPAQADIMNRNKIVRNYPADR